jgi:hypothetical protein
MDEESRPGWRWEPDPPVSKAVVQEILDELEREGFLLSAIGKDGQKRYRAAIYGPPVVSE